MNGAGREVVIRLAADATIDALKKAVQRSIGLPLVDQVSKTWQRCFFFTKSWSEVEMS